VPSTTDGAIHRSQFWLNTKFELGLFQFRHPLRRTSASILNLGGNLATRAMAVRMPAASHPGQKVLLTCDTPSRTARTSTHCSACPSSRHSHAYPSSNSCLPCSINGGCHFLAAISLILNDEWHKPKRWVAQSRQTMNGTNLNGGWHNLGRWHNLGTISSHNLVHLVAAMNGTNLNGGWHNLGNLVHLVAAMNGTNLNGGWHNLGTISVGGTISAQSHRTISSISSQR